MAEGLFVVTPRESSPAVRRATVGVPISPLDEAVILIPDTEDPVPDGEIGELCARGPYTLRGYFDAADHNARAFTTDGFYRTGDLAATTEIDGTRAVEAAIVAMPDPRLGERGCAYLVTDGTPLDLDDLRAHLDGLGVAKFKWPERLELLDQLPRTKVGKLDKRSLSADITTKLRAEGALPGSLPSSS